MSHVQAVWFGADGAGRVGRKIRESHVQLQRAGGGGGGPWLQQEQGERSQTPNVGRMVAKRGHGLDPGCVCVCVCVCVSCSVMLDSLRPHEL